MNDRFKMIFWFIVGICLFAAILSFYIIITDRTQTAMILTFWLTTGAASAIAYLIGGTPNQKKPEPGTTSVEITSNTDTNDGNETKP